jgi:hypothetical protein
MFKERQVIKSILQHLYAEHNGSELIVNPDKEWDVETIEEIAETLKDNGYTPQHAINLKPEDQISIVWGVNDIIDRARQIHDWCDMSEEQGRYILHEMKKRHDACNGLSWDVIDVYINEARLTQN